MLLTAFSAVYVGHSTGGGEVVRYLARHGDTRTAKAVLVMHGDDDQIVPTRTQALCLRSSCRTQHFNPWNAHDAGGHEQRRPPSLRAVLKGHSDMTIYTPELVQRNATFAASGAFKGLPFPTNPALRVIGCVDSRVDPSDVLGLKLGEAVVMRNVGGRVTPEALRSWALLGR